MRPDDDRTEWTPARRAEVVRLWSTDASTAEIARQLGVTKSALIGIAHRLRLSRPSPLKPPRADRPPKVLRAPRRTLDALAPTPPAPAPDVAAPAPPTLVRERATIRHACCWPIGHPGTPGFRFCGAEAVTRRPYCDAHCAVAYVKIDSDRRRHGEP